MRMLNTTILNRLIPRIEIFQAIEHDVILSKLQYVLNKNDVKTIT